MLTSSNGDEESNEEKWEQLFRACRQICLRFDTSFDQDFVDEMTRNVHLGLGIAQAHHSWCILHQKFGRSSVVQKHIGRGRPKISEFRKHSTFKFDAFAYAHFWFEHQMPSFRREHLTEFYMHQILKNLGATFGEPRLHELVIEQTIVYHRSIERFPQETMASIQGLRLRVVDEMLHEIHAKFGDGYTPAIKNKRDLIELFGWLHDFGTVAAGVWVEFLRTNFKKGSQ